MPRTARRGARSHGSYARGPPPSSTERNNRYGKTSEQEAQDQAEKAQGPCGALAELRVLRAEGEKEKEGETPSDRAGRRAGHDRRDDMDFPVRLAEALTCV